MPVKDEYAENGRRPLRVAVAGLGRTAFAEHLPALRGLPHMYTVVAVCDLLKERRDMVEKDNPDVRTYRRVEDMLDDPDIDLVDIALPSLDHVKVALSSLNRNLWTVVETPVAMSSDGAALLKAAAARTRGKLIPVVPGMFSREFLLAGTAVDTGCLGDIFDLRVRVQDYVRRDDWQSVRRCGGGCVWHFGTEAVLQTMSLLGAPPLQMWSELKRLVSLGDAEDYARIIFTTRGGATADIEICGGAIPPPEPAFTLRGTRGVFTVDVGAQTGTLRALSPGHKFPRRRSSVRTPSFADLHEALPVTERAVELPADACTGPSAFWQAVHRTVCTGAPFPVGADDIADAVRYLQIAKQSSAFK